MAESSFRPVLLCGESAVKTCFEQRPKAIKRLWLAEEWHKPFSDLCQWMAREKLSYSTSNERELDRIAGHSAHGGIIAATERPPLALPKPADYADWQAANTPLLFLENIADPLQIGAIARVAAASGISHLLLSGSSTEAIYAERAWSTAAGALDMLKICDAGPLPPLLRQLQSQFCIVGFTRPGGRRVDQLKPIRAPGRPPAIVLGDTATGVSSEVVGKCEHLLHIPGVGGSTWLNAADTAAFGLPWLLRKERNNEGEGFLAQKRARQQARRQG